VFNLARAGFNFNDGFGGGDAVYENVLFNTCRESSDHGPINSWDRQPFLTTVRTGEPSMQMQWRNVTRNIVIANYGKLSAAPLCRRYAMSHPKPIPNRIGCLDHPFCTASQVAAKKLTMMTVHSSGTITATSWPTVGPKSSSVAALSPRATSRRTSVWAASLTPAAR